VRLIDQWLVSRSDSNRDPASIQLLVGDLASIPIEHAVDALVVSAFPDSYSPTPGTLFASLQRAGLDMEQVAKRKEEDERSRLGCWISKPLPRKVARSFHFVRIICFEPLNKQFVANTHPNPKSPQDAVAFVFRCLNNFAAADIHGKQRFKLTKLAMPLLATGNQAIPIVDLLPRLLESAVFWLEAGLPVEELKVVAYSAEDVDTASRIFREAKAAYRPQTQGRRTATTDRDPSSVRPKSKARSQSKPGRAKRAAMPVAPPKKNRATTSLSATHTSRKQMCVSSSKRSRRRRPGRTCSLIDHRFPRAVSGSRRCLTRSKTPELSWPCFRRITRPPRCAGTNSNARNSRSTTIEPL
jgi:hypothetical protein